MYCTSSVEDSCGLPCANCLTSNPGDCQAGRRKVARVEHCREKLAGFCGFFVVFVFLSFLFFSLLVSASISEFCEVYVEI